MRSSLVQGVVIEVRSPLIWQWHLSYIEDAYLAKNRFSDSKSEVQFDWFTIESTLNVAVILSHLCLLSA